MTSEPGPIRVSDLVAEAMLPPHETRRLIAAVLDVSVSHLWSDPPIEPSAADSVRRLVARRVAGEPLQYLEGTVSFGPLELRIDRRALIPRPETEEMWERIVATIEPPEVIVDLGTGSGALALALKHSYPGARVVATDISSDALELADVNRTLTGLDIELRHGDLFEALPSDLRGRVDLLVSNPPYLAGDELATLPVDVRDHEPVTALVAGPRGTEVLDRIAAEAHGWLRPGGWLWCEISEFRAEHVGAAFAPYGASVLEDRSGRARFVVGRRAQAPAKGGGPTGAAPLS